MDIEEIVLDNPENQPDIEESLPDILVERVHADIEEVPVPKKAKAKGRPAGAKNKAGSKPRTKKVVIQEPIDTPQYEPSSPRRNLPMPEYGVNDVAVEMLRLLSDQQNAKQERKRQLYASWFN